VKNSKRYNELVKMAKAAQQLGRYREAEKYYAQALRYRSNPKSSSRRLTTREFSVGGVEQWGPHVSIRMEHGSFQIRRHPSHRAGRAIGGTRTITDARKIAKMLVDGATVEQVEKMIQQGFVSRNPLSKSERAKMMRRSKGLRKAATAGIKAGHRGAASYWEGRADEAARTAQVNPPGWAAVDPATGRVLSVHRVGSRDPMGSAAMKAAGASAEKFAKQLRKQIEVHFLGPGQSGIKKGSVLPRGARVMFPPAWVVDPFRKNPITGAAIAQGLFDGAMFGAGAAAGTYLATRVGIPKRNPLTHGEADLLRYLADYEEQRAKWDKKAGNLKGAHILRGVARGYRTAAKDFGPKRRNPTRRCKHNPCDPVCPRANAGRKAKRNAFLALNNPRGKSAASTLKNLYNRKNRAKHGGVWAQWVAAPNQAWFIMWQDQVLRVIPSADEALAEIQQLLLKKNKGRTAKKNPLLQTLGLGAANPPKASGAIRVPFKDGQKVPVQKAREWIKRNMPKLLPEFEKSIKLQTKANRAPTHVMWKLLPFGSSKQIEGVTALVHYGVSPESIYKPPAGSKKGDKDLWRHEWGDGTGKSKPVPVLVSTDGKMILHPLRRGQTIGQWMRG